MDVTRNSFADARMNGYLDGLLQRIYAADSELNTEVVHDEDRTEDYIRWYNAALKAGFNTHLDFSKTKGLFNEALCKETLCKEDFTAGFLYGWKGGYNHGYRRALYDKNMDNGFVELYNIGSLGSFAPSLGFGVGIGFNDGECRGRHHFLYN